MIVLLGPPGAGKGTQAAILSGRLGIPHVSTGDLFRAAIRDATAIGREAQAYMQVGQLVPDDVTIRMLLERLSREDARRGAILDGFPRNRAQAEALDVALAERGSRVDEAILIDVPGDELVRRAAGRRICQTNGHVYNVVSNPPLVDGVCDLDGSPLVQRADDREETVRARLAEQLPPLEDVIAHYRAHGVLRPVDGLKPIAAVSEALAKVIDDDSVADASPA